MFIYQIKLPKKQNAEEFVKFMEEVYFPAVNKGPTRVGQVTDLILLKQLSETGGDAGKNEFFWHVGWSGLFGHGGGIRIDDEDAKRKFDAFKPKVKLIGFFKELVEWHERS